MNRPLAGVRVIELARVLAGPYCGMVLADLGADVIKVERPGIGDDLRHWGPPFTSDGESTYFLTINRSKRSIAINVKDPTGRVLLERLLQRSEVLIENFRPGGMEALGLDHARLAQINPDLIHCSITAAGTVGPLRDQPGYDVMVQAMSGLMSVTGEPSGDPMRVGVAFADILGGLYAAVGVLAALAARARNEAATSVSTSLLEVAMAALPNLTGGYLMAGVAPHRLGNAHPNAAPYGVYPTKDSRVVIAVGSDEQWRRLCSAMGQSTLASQAGWATNAERIAHRADVDRQVTTWFSAYGCPELLDLLGRYGVPAAPINTVPEAIASPQVEALRMVKHTDHPTAGPLSFIGSPLRVGGEAAYRPAPRLGGDRRDVLRSVLGLDDKAIEELEATGIFDAESVHGME